MAKVTIEKMNQNQIHKFGIEKWPIWEKEISVFDWFYDSQEQCFFIEGEVEIVSGEEKYFIQKGDFVTFEQGLKCTWKIIKPVKKYYNFE